MRYKSKVYPKSSISWGHHYLHEIKDGKAVRIQDQKSPAPLRYRARHISGAPGLIRTPPAGKLAKLAEINSSGTISKTKRPNLLASYCWAFYENRDTERNALR